VTNALFVCERSSCLIFQINNSKKGKRKKRFFYWVLSSDRCSCCWGYMRPTRLLWRELFFFPAAEGITKSDMLLCVALGMREFIIISFQQQHVSLSWLMEFSLARCTKRIMHKGRAGRCCFSVNKYKNEGPSMTGGTWVLIGGPFVFPCGSTWHAQRVSQVQQPTPFYGPRNFPKSSLSI
jgi:hypothetical protein